MTCRKMLACNALKPLDAPCPHRVISGLPLCAYYTHTMRMKKPVNLSLDPRLVERARLAASTDGVSLSAWVSRLISGAIRYHDSVTDAAPPAISHPREKPPAVSRSAPCPCGSGLKYKRCCGMNA